MKITDAYKAARGMTGTVTGQALAAAFRGLFRAEFERQQHEDDALAALRALGDDGTHLRQAVALALVAATDADVEQLLNRIARGDELNAVPDLAHAVASVTPCSCSAQRERADRAEAERDAVRKVMDAHRCGPQAERGYARAVAAESAVQRIRDIIDAEPETVTRHRSYLSGLPDSWGNSKLLDRLRRALDGEHQSCDECDTTTDVRTYGTVRLCPSCHHDAVRSGWTPGGGS